MIFWWMTTMLDSLAIYFPLFCLEQILRGRVISTLWFSSFAEDRRADSFPQTWFEIFKSSSINSKWESTFFLEEWIKINSRYFNSCILRVDAKEFLRNVLLFFIILTLKNSRKFSDWLLRCKHFGFHSIEFLKCIFKAKGRESENYFWKTNCKTNNANRLVRNKFL